MKKLSIAVVKTDYSSLRFRMLLWALIGLLLQVSFVTSLRGTSSDPPKKSTPISIYFVPSMEPERVQKSGQAIAEFLQETTGYKFRFVVPTGYAAVIEALANGQADIAWLPTFAYIVANKLHDSQVALMTIRNGMRNYRGQFVVRKDSGIKTLADIQGKRVAFTDAASTSGYIYPHAKLKQMGITPKTYQFTGGHAQAVLSVYSGKFDVACTYWSPDDSTGNHYDARSRVLEGYPDIYEQTEVIGFTDWIPNDALVFGKSLSSEMKKMLTQTLLDYAKTDQGIGVLKQLYDIDGLSPATDSDYDIVREALKVLDLNAESYIR